MDKTFEDLNKDLEQSIKNKNDLISKKNSEKREQKEIYDAIRKEYRKLQQEIFDKNFASDFKNLTEMYKKYEKGYGLMSVYLQDYEKSLEIINFDKDTELNLICKGNCPNYWDSIQELKKFKLSKESFHLLVEERAETIPDDNDIPSAPIVRYIVGEKKFSFKDKKKAYEYFNELFKKKILGL
jgi:hypothetical protein